VAFLWTGDKGEITNETTLFLSPYLPAGRRWGEEEGKGKN